MIITDLNRERAIGANSMLLEIGPFRILVDSGLHPKHTGLQATPDFTPIEDGPLDLILLTHCHLDHLGSLPLAARLHPDTPIVCTRGSQMLAARMLRNSCNVMKRQREEFNITEYPLYSFQEVEHLDGRILGLPFNASRQLQKQGDTLEYTLFSSGHITGAAGIRLIYKHRKIFITGDVLFEDQQILPGADFPEEEWDTLILETTHGATQHPENQTRASEVKRLINSIDKTIDQGGSVLIPVFALGRMQEVLALLYETKKQKKLPDCPIFCSGLGLDLVDYFDAICRKTGQVQFRRSTLTKLKVQPLSQDFTPGRSPGKPGIYILSSGMLVEHTPSYKAAAALLDNHRNTINFVGYCDPATPGGQLLQTPQEENFLFDKLDYVCPVRATIGRFDLSGHANREELLQFALAANPRAVVLTHGDPEARDWFQDALAEANPKLSITDPVPGKRYQV